MYNIRIPRGSVAMQGLRRANEVSLLMVLFLGAHDEALHQHLTLSTHHWGQAFKLRKKALKCT